MRPNHDTDSMGAENGSSPRFFNHQLVLICMKLVKHAMVAAASVIMAIIFYCPINERTHNMDGHLVVDAVFVRSNEPSV